MAAFDYTDLCLFAAYVEQLIIKHQSRLSAIDYL